MCGSVTYPCMIFKFCLNGYLILRLIDKRCLTKSPVFMPAKIYILGEPLDDRIDVLRKLPNVRKVSMSPWVNQERGASEIRGDYAFSRKPSPALLAFDPFDPNAVYEDLMVTRKACEKYHCPLEFILKDISTVRYEPKRLWEWEKIAMEEAGDVDISVSIGGHASAFIVDACAQAEGKAEPEGTARQAGIERITVPAGEFSCYRVEIRIHILILNPTTVCWVSTEKPHFVVRYEGKRSLFGPKYTTTLIGKQ